MLFIYCNHMFNNNRLYKYTCSAFDHCNGSHFNALLANARRMAGIHNVSDILVRLGCLLHNQLGTGHPNGNAYLLQLVQHLLVVQITTRLSA